MLVASVGVLFSGVAAVAAPTPDSGPIEGGTAVTLEIPTRSFEQVASGTTHSLMLDSEGCVFAAGFNMAGQLGDGTTENSSTMVAVSLPDGVRFAYVAAGGVSSVALDANGSAWVWGGQYEPTPAEVEMPAGVSFTQLSTSGLAFVALDADGRAWAWGNGSSGQLGNGTNGYSETPVQVEMPVGVTFTALSSLDLGFAAVGSDGLVYTWGTMYMTNGGVTQNSDVPVAFPTPAGVSFTAVAVGSSHIAAVASDGSVYAWGDNDYGQLGDGTSTGSMAPVQVQLPAGVTAAEISAGNRHTVMLGSDGRAYAWGWNAYTQLGNGATANSNVPVAVHLPAGLSLGSLATGFYHTLAIDSGGSLILWGADDSLVSGESLGLENDEAGVYFLTASALTGATFGGAAADPAEFVQVSPGVWTVVTPPHAAGNVDVVIDWTEGGIAQDPIAHAGAFTYIDFSAAPTIVSDPRDGTANDGQEAAFAVEVAGSDPMTVIWEVSRDGGATWEEIAADPAATVSADGLSIAVTASAANDGFQYRAVATNPNGSAASAAATLTTVFAEGCVGTDCEQVVKPTTPPTTPTTPPVPDDEPTDDSAWLAVTGSGVPLATLMAGGLLILAGSGALTIRRMRAPRV